MKKLKDPCEWVMGGLGWKWDGERFSPGTLIVAPPPTVLQVKLLKHTKCDIVGALCVLPQTRHDFSSFVVDTWFQTVSSCFLSRAGLGSHRGCLGGV